MAKQQDHSGVKTARSGMIYVVGQVAASVGVLLTLAILARLLRPESFGLYSIIIAFYTFMGMLGNFSIGTATRKKMVEQKSMEEKRRLISNTYVASLSISLVIALIGVVFSGYIANNLYHQPIIAGPLVLVSLLIVFWAVLNLTLATLVALGRVAEATYMDIVYAIVQLIAATLLVVMGYGIMGAIVGLAIGIVAGTLLGLYYVIRTVGWFRLKAEGKRLKDILGFAAPVYLSYLVMQGVYIFAILILGIFVSAAIVGNYNIAYELGGFVTIILSSNTFVLLPAFSAASKSAKSKKRIGEGLNRSIYYTLLFLGPLVAYAASIATPIVYILFSKSYTYAPLYLGLVAVGLTLGLVWNYISTIMLGMGDMKRFLKYQIAAAAFELVLLFVLTPTFHVAGMIAALFVIVPITLDIAYVRAIRKDIDFVPKMRKPALVVVSSVIVFLLLYAVSLALHQAYLAIPVNLVLGLLLYPPLLAMLGGFSRPDLGFVTKTIGKGKMTLPVSLLVRYAGAFVR